MGKLTPGLAVTAAVLAAVAVGGMVGAVPAGAATGAASHGRAPRLSIASPATGNLVAGLVPVAVAFDAGAAGRITAIELWVDDQLYSSQVLDMADPRGTHSIDWDTLRLRNGQHSLKVRAFSGHKMVAVDSAIVTVSNGGVDVVPPLVSFYSPLDGQTVSGNLSIGVNAADNDQVALVGLFVNRQLRMMKSNPPFQYTLDTTTLPLLNGRGVLVLEAWAYDRAQNRGVAKPVTVYVNNPLNATPLQPDPKAPKGSRAPAPPKGGKTPAPAPASPPIAARPAEPPVVTKPEPTQVARLSPLEALLAPAPSAAPTPVDQPKVATPATPPAPQAAPHAAPGRLTPAPTRRVEVTLAPKPSPGVRSAPPSPERPSRTRGAVRPRPADPRLEVALSPSPAGLSAAAGRPAADRPRSVTPSRTPAPKPVKPSVKPAPVSLAPLEIARVPEGELVAVPRSPEPAAVQPSAQRPEGRRQSPAAPNSAPAPAPAAERLMTAERVLPKPAARASAPALPPVTPVKPPARASAPSRTDGVQRGSTPDRIVLPVYRLARLPESPSSSRRYTVHRGDTLGEIARKHGVTPRSILVANGLLGASELSPGRHITIPGTITIAYNDQPVGFDVQPRVEGGMAITPFRQIFEHTGGVVRYHPVEREVRAASPDKEIRLKIGSREALVNSAVILMDRAAFLDSGRTMVPVKFMTEALDLKAEYDLRTGAIYLIHK